MISPYDTEIKQLEAERDRIGAELSEAKQRRAEFLCPYKVGDILEDKKGKQAKVVEIKSGWSDYTVNLCHILKSGKTGLVTHTLYDWDGWKPV
uniref:Uncharacterized protein n=1 Tax=viral metagenome TaxID=1070528 RepID=A0A6M3J554_9ZZZZ